MMNWANMSGDEDLVDKGNFDYFSFCDLMERIMLRYNRIIKPDKYNDLTNLSKIVYFINNTEPPKDEEGKNFLIRKRMLYYS